MSTKRRHRDLEKLQERTRAEIPSAAVKWLAAARKPLERLTKAALSGEVSDAEFRGMVEAFSKSLPGLLDKLDHGALAKPLEEGMGAAMANGIAERLKTGRQKTGRQKTEDGETEEKRAKRPGRPGDGEAFLGGQKRRANGQFGEGDGQSSRKKRRRKPTRKEKIEAEQTRSEHDPGAGAAIERYRKGITIQSPTGRSVEFGEIAAGHIARKEGSRSRFADLAEDTVANPDAIWSDGLRNRYIKAPREGGRNRFLVVTTQISETREIVITFTKQPPNKKNPPGRRIYPAE